MGYLAKSDYIKDILKPGGILSDCFAHLKSTSAKTVCYGTDSGGKFVVELMSCLGLDVCYFADANNYGGKIRGIKVLSLEELAILDKSDNIQIFITSVNESEVYGLLRGIGMRGQIFVKPTVGWDYNIIDLLPLLAADNINRFKSDAAVLRGSLMDDTSRKVLDHIIDARINCMLEGYIEAIRLSVSSSGSRQYLLEELRGRLTARPLSVVDCGAYSGDTVIDMLNWGISFADSWCFEPEPKNFPKLEDNLARLGVIDKVNAVKAGVYSYTGRLSFLSDEIGTQSRILDSESSISIPVVTLDEYLHDKKVDFIKMDIECAEAEALAGARALISRCRPILAICVYHRFMDLVRIPLQLIEWLKGYDFMLRQHGGPIDHEAGLAPSWQKDETVFYCIPRYNTLERE